LQLSHVPISDDSADQARGRRPQQLGHHPREGVEPLIFIVVEPLAAEIPLLRAAGSERGGAPPLSLRGRRPAAVPNRALPSRSSWWRRGGRRHWGRAPVAELEFLENLASASILYHRFRLFSEGSQRMMLPKNGIHKIFPLILTHLRFSHGVSLCVPVQQTKSCVQWHLVIHGLAGREDVLVKSVAGEPCMVGNRAEDIGWHRTASGEKICLLSAALSNPTTTTTTSIYGRPPRHRRTTTLPPISCCLPPPARERPCNCNSWS
jgi:hypothetical protein